MTMDTLERHSNIPEVLQVMEEEKTISLQEYGYPSGHQVHSTS